MKILIVLSDFIMPLTIFYIVGFGLLMKQNVYEDFVKGAVEGIKTVADIMPTLIGLMVGVGILRASGFLDMLSMVIGEFTKYINFPAELVPLAIVKMFSSSASTGLLLDLFKKYGPDSFIGTTASIMMSCTDATVILGRNKLGGFTYGNSYYRKH